jgi:hypothetical protein
MNYRIYYTNADNKALAVDRTDLQAALSAAESLRCEGNKMVTIVAADLNENQIGKPGVSGVENGKLPDGSDYDWTKNDRVGAAFKSK